MSGDPTSQRYLIGRLNVVEGRVRALVEHRRRFDADPDDRFRGLYVSDDKLDDLLRSAGDRRDLPALDPSLDALARKVEAEADLAERDGDDIRLRALARQFALSSAEVNLLMVALAPDLDPRFEQVFGYLNDDVTRKRASVGTALTLSDANFYDGTARARLGPHGRLVTSGLLHIEDRDRPVLSRGLRVPDRVISHLLGDDAPEPALRSILVSRQLIDTNGCEIVRRALLAESPMFYAVETTRSAGSSYLANALAAAGRPVVAVDLGLLTDADDPAELLVLASREARLRRAALLVVNLDVVAERHLGAIRSLTAAPGLLALTGTRNWDPRWSQRPPLVVDVPVAADDDRRRSWARAVGSDDQVDDQVWRGLAAFRLTHDQVNMAADAARQSAAAAGRPVSTEDLQTGARAQNAAGLERLARRISPRATWADLVLPETVEAQLREMTARVRQRPRVLDEWRMGRASSRGRGITVLFAGDSGTGKTMSAEVVAGALGLDLYVIDLSSVVDKYIGETEKNLDRIFVEAERVNGVLLFDEADAIFGKRSEVRDARDRYANVEVAYLLQRMEQFEGVAVLTTNLRANVDDAFLRRIDVLVDFPLPEAADRKRLWQNQFNAAVPRSPDIDFAFLSTAFELTGGNIRNVVLSAAFLAADADRGVDMRDLVRATAAEYRKLGRLCVQEEFGLYHSHLSPMSVA
jgi:hypothetical protein